LTKGEDKIGGVRLGHTQPRKDKKKTYACLGQRKRCRNRKLSEDNEKKNVDLSGIAALVRSKWGAGTKKKPDRWNCLRN